MEGQQQQTRVMREVTPQWDEIISLAERMEFGEIIIKIHDHRIELSDYIVRRKPTSTAPPPADLMIHPLN